MEINIWAYLCDLDDGHFLMRQHVPDICVFRGCRFDGWYYTSPGGLLTCRRDHVSIDDLLEVFCVGAGEAGHVPVAILRKRCTRLHGGCCDNMDIPHAVVLNTQEVQQLLERVQRGIEETDVWSLQTIVEPVDGLRVVSMYSCDANGDEKSDIFARPYHKAYPAPACQVVMPSAQDFTDDCCIEVPPCRRQEVESRTLSAVRFASRFCNVEFEGLVLEFLFTVDGHALLHACLCASILSPEALCRMRSRSVANPRVGSLPRAFPVPTVVKLIGKCHMASAKALEEAEEDGRPASPNGAEQKGCGPSSCTTLEFWRGEQFLGEALLPLQGWGVNHGEYTLELNSGGMSWPSRSDSRKRLASAAHATAGKKSSVTVSVEWVARDSQRVRLTLLHAQGLPPLLLPLEPLQGPECPGGPHAVLWHRRWGHAEFLEVWTSSQAREGVADGLFCSTSHHGLEGSATAPVWNESVEFSLSEALDEGPKRAARTAATTLSATTSKRPNAEREVAGSTLPMEPTPGCRGPIELTTSLKSAHEHVCGAELFTHWGMSESDGSMRSHILSSQVSQRLSTDSRGQSTTRSSLLTKLSQQLGQYHDMQLEWEKDLAAAKASVARATEAVERRDKEVEHIRDGAATLAKEHKKCLASLCCEQCGHLDEQNFQLEADEAALQQSRQHIAEQRPMLRQLKERNEGLQDALYTVVRKFDEASTLYAVLQRELLRRRESTERRPSTPADLRGVLNNADSLLAEVAKEGQALEELKHRLRRLQEEMRSERAHSVKLVELLRRMAALPAAKMRTGGGFDMDCAVRREAALLVQEMARA
mmetsp:Transcript_85977/g.199899  ORF Transcript_85977/g.199899 Transcript_85977/m.199899 type:complete len:818 (+) Transcript_85977:38-2491(+)